MESGHSAASFPPGHLPILSTGQEPRAQTTDLGRRALRGREGSRTFVDFGSWREKLESCDARMPVKKEGQRTESGT